MECFTNLWDKFHISIWERSHRKQKKKKATLSKKTKKQKQDSKFICHIQDNNLRLLQVMTDDTTCPVGDLQDF